MADQISTVVTTSGNTVTEAVFAQTPWHGKGIIMAEGEIITSEVAIEKGNLGWGVTSEPIFLADGTPCANRRAIVRDDIRTTLGIVSPKYRPLQNREAFSFLDSLMMDGVLQYESAFALRGGEQIALLARLPSVDIVIEGDTSLRYVLLTNSHDGTGAMTVLPTGVRVVCANTIALALQSGKNRTLSMRHMHSEDSKNEKLDMMRNYLSQFDAQFTAYTDAARSLTKVNVGKDAGWKFIKELFPEPASDAGARAKTTWQAKTDRIVDLYRHDATNNLPGMGGTWWSLFNAVTQYLDHESNFRGVNAVDNKIESVMYGKIAQTKARAMELALAVVA